MVCTFGTVPVADAAVAGRLVVLSTGDRFESGTCRRHTSIEGVPPDASSTVASANGRRVAFVARDRATIVALPSGRVVAQLRHPTRIASLVFDAAGNRAITAADNSVVARIWDVSRGELERELTGHYGDVVVATLDPTGVIAVTGSNDGQGRVWDANTGRALSVLSGHLNFVEQVAITRDGTSVATGSPDRTARTWTTTGRLIALHTRHKDAVTAMTFTPDGYTLVTGSDDGTVRVWDAGTTPDLASANAVPPRPPSLEKRSPDGSVIASAKGTDVRLVTSDGATVELTGHEDSVTSVDFSPDGQRLVTASRDNDAILWDVETGRQRSVLRAHFGPVFDAQFSPDGRWIVTAGPTAAGLWSASNGAFVRFLRGAPNPLAAAGFSEDSRTIVTVSRDGTISRYRCDICGTTAELLEIADARLRATDRKLTKEERSLYLG